MKKLMHFLALSLFAASTFAANITVTNTSDAGTGSLREAITTANSNGQDDVITITAAGTITLATDFPVISTNMTITGPGSTSLTIDGVNTHKIFEITGSSTVVIMEGIKIIRGKGKTYTTFLASAASLYGGAIFNLEATVTLNNCVVNDNTKSHIGGAFFNDSGFMTLNNCTFSGNMVILNGAANAGSTGRAGVCYNLSDTNKTARSIFNNCTLDNNSSNDIAGAIAMNSFDVDVNDSVVEMYDCIVSNNSTPASGRSGGAVQVPAGTFIFVNSTMTGNSCANGNGGGIYTLATSDGMGGSTGAKIIAINSTFTNNSASSNGGVMSNDAGVESVLFQNCTFDNNTAVGFGGALKLQGGVTIDQCTFSNNKATGGSGQGGAIDIPQNSSGTINISNTTFFNNRSEAYGGAVEQGGTTTNFSNCTFTGNSAKLSGGAVENWQNATTTMTNCTVIDNSIDAAGAADAGLGQYNSAPFTITNTIVYNNKLNGGAGAEDNFFGTINSGGHNIVGESGGFNTSTDDLINTNPNLAALANNGGAVQTRLPNSGSPAINHVDNGSAPCTDARLAARTGNSDVGAYETAGTFSDISISVSPASVVENSGTNLVYTFTRTGQTCGDLLVSFSVGGTAVLSSDYSTNNQTTFTSSVGSVLIPDGSASGSLNVTPIDNALTDGSRTVVLTVTSGGGYNIGGTNVATGTITDDEAPPIPTITLTASQTTQGESSGTAMLFTFTRTAPTTGALVVNFTISGSADPTSDYSLSGQTSFNAGAKTGTITIADGQNTKQLMITPTSDSLVEGSETVTVTIAAP